MNLLVSFDIPNNLKEERKNVTVNLYKFLTKLKNEIAGKIDEMIADIMGKMKYPYLF
jgi:hypothetical protein